MRFRLIALLSLAFIACVVLNRVTGAAPVPATETYKVDSVHSSNCFRIKHANVSYFYGRFNEMSGTFTVDAENPSNVAFDVTIKTASIDTNNKGRDKHVTGPELFDAEKYPTITFKSTKTAAKGEHSYDVTGDLTLHGVTKSINVTIDHTGSGEMRGKSIAGYETKFTVKRSDYGMGAMIPMLGDEITLVVSLEGVKD